MKHRVTADFGSALPLELHEQLPLLAPAEAIQALNASGLLPDPDEVWRAYTETNTPTPEAAAVLAHLQLLVRQGDRWADQRQLAELAATSPSTVSRCVDRLRQLGLVATSGGERVRRGGKVERSCLHYRLTWSSAIELKPHRLLQARLWAWSRGAGVPAREAAACLRRGPGGVQRLRLLVSACRLKPRRGRPVVVVPSSHGRDQVAPEQRGAAAIGDILRARLEHGASSSKPLVLRPSWSEGYRDSRQGLKSPESAHDAPGVRIDHYPDSGHSELETSTEPSSNPVTIDGDPQLLRTRCEALAATIRDRAPRAMWHEVVRRATRGRIPLARAVELYEQCVAEARVESRIGNVAAPAAWAAAGFRRRVREEAA
ncbi:MarR family transcriptional regulator [bacterium]|nr:MAG: MarR family transcriptional regulator [bacterium]